MAAGLNSRIWTPDGYLRDNIANIVYFWAVLFAITATLTSEASISRQTDLENNKKTRENISTAHTVQGCMVAALVLILVLYSVIIYCQSDPKLANPKVITFLKMFCFFSIVSITTLSLWSVSQGVSPKAYQFDTRPKYRTIVSLWWSCFASTLLTFSLGVFALCGYFGFNPVESAKNAKAAASAFIFSKNGQSQETAQATT